MSYSMQGPGDVVEAGPAMCADRQAALRRRRCNAQADGLLKPLDATVLMELVFGAFVGMMRAHWEGRIDLTDELVDQAEKACWDAVRV